MTKILLIKRGAIGDVLMTTPLIRQLKTRLNVMQLDYCVGNSASSALKNNSYLDNLIILPDEIFTVRGAIRFCGFMLSIRHKYDYMFILGKNWLINLCARFSGTKLLGFARESISRYLLDRYVVYNDIGRYHGLYYLDLLAQLQKNIVDYNDVGLDLAISAQDKLVVKTELEQLNISMPYKFVVVTNSGGNNQFETGGIRMLPTNLIVELLTKLAQKQEVILLGGGVDYVTYQKYVQAVTAKHRVINMAGKLSISQSCYILTLAQHFFTTDCGVMHLGIAAGIEDKMSCFFGPSNPAHALSPYYKGRILWQDESLYEKDYQLYGRLPDKSKKFFTRVCIDEVI